MTARGFVLVTHRWVGLATSAILSIVGGTGAVIVWDGDHLLRKVADRLHGSLALGKVGAWVVLAATGAAVVLQIGGLILWWRSKTIRVRTGAGWRRTLIDLHYSLGVLGLPVMFTLALTGLAMPVVTPQEQPALRRLIMDFHTSRAFSVPVKLLYTVATTGFLIQGVTGVIMWWKPQMRTRLPGGA